MCLLRGKAYIVNICTFSVLYNNYTFLYQDTGIPNPAYGTTGRFSPSKNGEVIANGNTDEVVANEAVYETMPDDNQDELVQSVKNHYEADYDVVL